MKKMICGALMSICLFWILGVAGSLECDNISIAEFVAREVPALLILYGSFWIGGFNK